jgi:hypothetical protein
MKKAQTFLLCHADPETGFCGSIAHWHSHDQMDQQ